MNRESLFDNSKGQTPDGITHLPKLVGKTITEARMSVAHYFTREHVTMSLVFDDGTFMDIDFDGHPPTNGADSSGSITVWDSNEPWPS